MTRPDPRDPERFPAALSAEDGEASAERAGRQPVTCGNAKGRSPCGPLPFVLRLPGFEPRTTEPKSAVLPLHHRLKHSLESGTKIRKKSQYPILCGQIIFYAGRLSVVRRMFRIVRPRVPPEREFRGGSPQDAPGRCSAPPPGGSRPDSFPVSGRPARAPVRPVRTDAASSMRPARSFGAFRSSRRGLMPCALYGARRALRSRATRSPR